MSSAENVETAPVEVAPQTPEIVEPVPVAPKKNTAAKRNFTVVSVVREGKEEDFKGGKYQAKTPAGAARKAANQACKSLYEKENCTVEITIKETTKNHPSKEYSYQATRTHGTKDVNFKESGVKIPFEFSMLLKSLKKAKNGEVVATPVAVEDDTVTEVPEEKTA